MRGDKWRLYEGGSRAPAIAWWPGRLQPRKVQAAVHVVDWVPTLCAQVDSRSAKDLKWDGSDICNALDGQSPQPTRTFYWQGQVIQPGDPVPE